MTPFGDIVVDADYHGALMGNRGGRIHDPQTRTLLPGRPWKSRAWIACVLAWRGRSRTVMGDSYTELFFLDEPTALAAGHRPCFECRRAEANAFGIAFAAGHAFAPGRAKADQMDPILHRDRLLPLDHPARRGRLADLPDGAMAVLLDGIPGDGPPTEEAIRSAPPVTVIGGRLRPWSPAAAPWMRSRPADAEVVVLTPRSIVATLRAGYRPRGLVN